MCDFLSSHLMTHHPLSSQKECVFCLNTVKDIEAEKVCSFLNIILKKKEKTKKERKDGSLTIKVSRRENMSNKPICSAMNERKEGSIQA